MPARSAEEQLLTYLRGHGFEFCEGLNRGGHRVLQVTLPPAGDIPLPAPPQRGEDEPEPAPEAQLVADAALARALQDEEVDHLAAIPAPATEAQLAAVPADLLLLARRLGDLGGLSGSQRIRRSYFLGRQDQEVALQAARGIAPFQRSDRIPGQRSSAYVVLRDGNGVGPFFTRSGAVFDTLVKVDRTWIPGTVSRSFASQSEAVAYIRGAGFDALPDAI
jgi:hypothetical protein